jgi:hypothetical protein
MGNTISEEDVAEENSFFKLGLNLESPEADSKMNLGTAAPNCQPKHTTSLARSQSMEGQEAVLSSGQSGEKSDGNSNGNSNGSSNGNGDGESSSSLGGMVDRPRPQRSSSLESSNSAQSLQDPKKMSYIQMAKMGYQELVNAIIRPPRAEYKVC